MTHPSSLDLEGYACGEALSAQLLAHVEECDACGAFVEELRGLVAAGPSANEADAAVARALARTQAGEEVAAAHEEGDRVPQRVRIGPGEGGNEQRDERQGEHPVARGHEPFLPRPSGTLNS